MIVTRCNSQRVSPRPISKYPRAENPLKARRLGKRSKLRFSSRLARLTHLDIYLSARCVAVCPNKGDHIWTNDVRERVLVQRRIRILGVLGKKPLFPS